MSLTALAKPLSSVKVWEFYMNNYCFFVTIVDLKKAFDTLNRNMMFSSSTSVRLVRSTNVCQRLLQYF